ncbi:MAG: MazG family protein [Defluviitaleaceae bacterium]|nr:MazG family protein [Defluviitaleaceae bacterium]
MSEEEQFVELCKIIDELLGENGCPWDKAQTHQSLRPHLLEESYEVAEAIDNNNMYELQEELGDLLLQVFLHSRIAQKQGHFNLSDVIKGLSEKMVRRHSHIFATDKAFSPEEAVATWEANKNKEKAIFSPLENMQAVPKALPALERAQKVIKRSQKEFPDCINEIRILLDKLECTPNNEEKKELYGNILFYMSAISAKMQINAEFSLTNFIQEFINTFE